MRWAAAAIVCLLAAGCTSQPPNLFGTAPAPMERVGGGILRIALPQDQKNCGSPDECTLLKAAEATQKVDGTHFMLMPGHGGDTQKGYAYIRVFTLETGVTAPRGAVSVAEAMHFFDKRQGQVAASR